jgi:type II secretory pathway component PulM
MPDRSALGRKWRRIRRRGLRRVRAYLRKHRKPIRFGLLGAGVLIGLGFVWILITGLLARQQAQNLENRLQTVRQLLTEGRLDEARHLAEGIPAIADRAHALTRPRRSRSRSDRRGH